MYWVCIFGLVKYIRARPAADKKFYCGERWTKYACLQFSPKNIYCHTAPVGVNYTNSNTEAQTEFIEIEIIKAQI